MLAFTCSSASYNDRSFKLKNYVLELCEKSRKTVKLASFPYRVYLSAKGNERKGRKGKERKEKEVS